MTETCLKVPRREIEEEVARDSQVLGCPSRPPPPAAEPRSCDALENKGRTGRGRRRRSPGSSGHTQGALERVFVKALALHNS